MLINDASITGSLTVNANSTFSGTITVTNGITGSITATNGVISGSSQLTSSFDTRYLVTGSVTSSISQLNIFTASAATTGSNTFRGTQTITGSFYLSGSTIFTQPSSSTTAAIIISGSDVAGGQGYLNFLQTKNTNTGVTARNKTFRVTDNGAVEIINSAYTGTLLTLGDGGDMTISGSIIMPTRPAFRVYGAGGTTASTTILSGSMTVVDYNQGGWNNTNGIFTAPLAGLYQVNIVVRCSGNSNPAAQIIVRKNSGGTITTQVMLEWAANTTANHMGGSTITKMAVGDTLYAIVTNGSISFDVNDNFSIAYIG
jgi:hypothetical protein